jgi:hypothetical protein
MPGWSLFQEQEVFNQELLVKDPESFGQCLEFNEPG